MSDQRCVGVTKSTEHTHCVSLIKGPIPEPGRIRPVKISLILMSKNWIHLESSGRMVLNFRMQIVVCEVVVVVQKFQPGMVQYMLGPR